MSACSFARRESCDCNSSGERMSSSLLLIASIVGCAEVR